MKQIVIEKVNMLPGTLNPNTFYLVSQTTIPGFASRKFLDLYLTDKDGTVVYSNANVLDTMSLINDIYTKANSENGIVQISGGFTLPGLQFETSPVITYNVDAISRIDYLSGNYKTFTYVDGKVSEINYFIFSLRDNNGLPLPLKKQKVIVYNQEGKIAHIDESIWFLE